MTDFTDFDSAILEFFDDFGFTATYIQRGVSTYNTSTGENVTTSTEIPVQAILLDLTLQSNGLSAKFGTLVMAGDKELYVLPPDKYDSTDDPLTVTTTADKVRVNGVEYTIVNMKEVNTTATDTLVYDFHIRR